MNRVPPAFPSREEGLRLHIRLCDLDPVAPADICRAYLPSLLRWLARTLPAADPHLRQSAAHDALTGYCRRPLSYDPRRGDLATYLRMAARSDLWNLIDSEERHHRGRVAFSVVELDEDRRNLSREEEEPSAQMERQEEEEQRARFWRSVDERVSVEERLVLELMLAGERRTAAFAEAAGLADLPPEEQQREVKRIKDRLKKRLEREGLKHGGFAGNDGGVGGE